MQTCEKSDGSIDIIYDRKIIVSGLLSVDIAELLPDIMSIRIEGSGYVSLICGDVRYEYVDFSDLMNGSGESGDQHTHSYTDTVVPPTCTDQGYTIHECECGDRYQDSEVEALGHDYVDGVCSRCGAEDPDYVDMTYYMEGKDLAEYVNQLHGDGTDYWDYVYQVAYTKAKPSVLDNVIDIYGDGSLCLWLIKNYDGYHDRLMIHTDSGDKLTIYGDCTNLFRGLNVNVSTISDKFNYGKITCLDYAFADMSESSQGDKGRDDYIFLDTKDVTSMVGCFQDSYLSSTTAYIHTWDFSNCSDISYMFYSMEHEKYTFYVNNSFTRCLSRLPSDKKTKTFGTWDETKYVVEP